MRRGALHAAHPQAISTQCPCAPCSRADQVAGDHAAAMTRMNRQPARLQPPAARLPRAGPRFGVPQPRDADDNAIPLRHQAHGERLETEPGEHRRLVASCQERQVARVCGDAGSVNGQHPFDIGRTRIAHDHDSTHGTSPPPRALCQTFTVNIAKGLPPQIWAGPASDVIIRRHGAWLARSADSRPQPGEPWMGRRVPG